MRLLLLKAGIFGESRNFRRIESNHVWEWDDRIRVWGFMLSMITVVLIIADYETTTNSTAEHLAGDKLSRFEGCFQAILFPPNTASQNS